MNELINYKVLPLNWHFCGGSDLLMSLLLVSKCLRNGPVWSFHIH